MPMPLLIIMNNAAQPLPGIFLDVFIASRVPGLRISLSSCRIFSMGRVSSQRPLCTLLPMTLVGKGMRTYKTNTSSESGKKKIQDDKGSNKFMFKVSDYSPVPSVSKHRDRRISEMSMWLRTWCRRQGFRFFDHWGLFWWPAFPFYAFYMLF